MRITTPPTEKPPCVIAIVEDEPEIRALVARFLESHGFVVWTADSAESFYRELVGRHTDLVVVDLGLPGEDGLSLIAHLHANGEHAIVALTARGTPDDQSIGLDAGADYYFVKPVDPQLLISGINAVLRRRSGFIIPPADDGTGTWLLVQEEGTLVTPNGLSLSLTSREVLLLECLMGHEHAVISKGQLLELFKQGNDEGDFNRIEALISRLRGKVMSASGLRLPVRSVYGQGLSFVGHGMVK